jgi:hypothetical protein
MLNLSKYIGLVLTVMTVGCSTEGPGVDFSVLPLELLELLEPAKAAAADWCQSSNNGCCPVINGGPNTIEQIDTPPHEDFGAWTIAKENHPTKIQVLIGFDKHAQFLLLRHELGHACAAAHNPENLDRVQYHLPPGNVMATWLDEESDELTGADIDFASVHY